MVLLSHPAVNAYTRNMALALSDAGLLHSMVTTLGWTPDAIPTWLPQRWRNQLSRRALPAGLGSRIRVHPFREAARLLASAMGIASLVRHETGFVSVDAVYRDLDRFVASSLKQVAGEIETVHAGEDGACATFSAARSLGLRCCYDLPIAHHKELQRLISEEKELMPEFASTLQGVGDSQAKLERKEREIAEADLIVVCSRFVEQSLTNWGVAASKIRVVPYGAPEGLTPREVSPDGCKRPLRVLFAGAVGQRKGIGYLLKAIQRLNRRDIELVVMGRIVGDGSALAPYRDLFRYESPRPHSEVLELMRSCDVMVLPSLVEGFALVIAEAMACGLPVIVTPNTGAADIVRDGLDGFIVPIRSVEAIAEKLSLLADGRLRAIEMGRSAAIRAAGWNWSCYRKSFVSAMTEVDSRSEEPIPEASTCAVT